MIRFKKIALAPATLALLITLSAAPRADEAPAAAPAADEQPSPTRQSWSFSGLFGTYDQEQLQRGFKVYKEVCSTCCIDSAFPSARLKVRAAQGSAKRRSRRWRRAIRSPTIRPTTKGEIF